LVTQERMKKLVFFLIFFYFNIFYIFYIFFFLLYFILFFLFFLILRINVLTENLEENVLIKFSLYFLEFEEDEEE